MDHASCLTCLTLSSSLRMMPTTYTGVPCNPSHPLQFPIISLSFILSAFPEGVAGAIPLVDAFYTSNFILRILQAYLNIECQLLLLSVVSTTFQLEFFCAVHPPVPLCRLHSTLIAFAPVLLLSREALSGITSAVTQSLSNDLNMTSGLLCLHPDKPPWAFVSALSATSV